MNLKFDTDTPKGVSPTEGSSVHLVVRLSEAVADGDVKHDGVGVSVVLHDRCVVVQRLSGGHDPLGIGAGQRVEAVEVLAIVEAIQVEDCGTEGWERVVHGLRGLMFDSAQR